MVTNTIFTANEATIQIWEEVNGLKTGDTLLEFRFWGNFSLEEQFITEDIAQLGYDEIETSITGKKYNFKIDMMKYITKSQYRSISDRSKKYQIEVDFFNETDGVQDKYTLHTCMPTGNWSPFKGADNQVATVNCEWQVKSYS